MPKPEVTKAGVKKKLERKDNWTLATGDLNRVKTLASEGDDFWKDMLAKYEQYGSLTDKQYDRVMKSFEELDNAPKFKTHDGKLVPVLNRHFVDQKASCITTGCRNRAAVAVPSTSGKNWVGVCTDCDAAASA
jgi:hypothetical protein